MKASLKKINKNTDQRKMTNLELGVGIKTESGMVSIKSTGGFPKLTNGEGAKDEVGVNG